MTRYARQQILPEVGAAGQARISAAHVLVVGAGGLGVLIFRGLHMMDNSLLLAGTLPVALLAVAADNLLEWGELRVQQAMGVFNVTMEEER